MVSVDITVDIPRRLPNSDERVLFPVPDVPAKSTRIFLLDSIREAIKWFELTDKVGGYIEIFKVFRLGVLIFVDKILLQDIFEKRSRNSYGCDVLS
jgi:hypothetical protein